MVSFVLRQKDTTK